jgi:hypothetical protein
MKDYKSRASVRNQYDCNTVDCEKVQLAYWVIVITVMSCSFAGWWLGL